MSTPPPKPGDGFLGWLGRQVGYVTKAVKTDVSPMPSVLHRDVTVAEHPMPGQPQVTLRRTVIDEAIVTRERKPIEPGDAAGQ